MTKSISGTQINLDELLDGIGHITAAKCVCFAEAASVCLYNNQHSQPVSMTLQGDTTQQVSVAWTTPTESIEASHHDSQQATEDGAYGVSFLIAISQTPYTVVQQSRKGTGIDWYLGYREEVLFQKAARLEVSGIAKASKNDIATRLARKRRQATRVSEGLPSYVCVVDFGGPLTVFEQV